MSEEKFKNEERPDDREVEWSFDFGNLGESFRRLIDSLTGDEELQTSRFTVEKGSASRADVDIAFSIGTGELRELLDSNNLMEAEIIHVGEIDFSAEGDTTKHIKLRQKTPKGVSAAPIRQGFRALFNNKDLRWNVGLSPDVPLNLEIDAGVGRVVADLSRLNLTGLNVKSGVGNVNLTLPAVDASYTTRIDGGVGQVTLKVPQGAAGKLDIKGGVGAVEVFVPYNTAVELRTTQGIGAVSVPGHFRRISDEFMGDKHYQTEGYELADKKLVIRYQGGVGQLRVSVIETV